MRSARKWQATAAIAAFALVLTGCAGGQTDEPDDKLRLMLPAGAVTRAFEPMLADFTAQTGIQVEFGSFENAELRQQQILDLSAGSGSLDVIMLQHSWLPEMADNLLPLDTYFDGDAAIDWDDYLPSMQQLSMRDDVPYMAPNRAFGEVLFYRTDLLADAGYDAPPVTTTEFLEQVAAMTDAEHYGYVGQASQTLFGVVQWTLWLRSFGGDILNDDWTEPIFNEAEGVSALEFFVDLYHSGSMDPGSIEFDNEGVIAALQQGRAAMGTGNFSTFLEIDNPANSEFAGNFGIAPYLPYAPGSGLEQGITNIGSWGFAINAHSDNADLAWELVKFASLPEVQEQMAVNGANGPTVAAVYESTGYAEVFPESAAVGQVLQYGKYFPTIAVWPQIQDVLASAITRALAKDVSPQEALDGAADEVRSILG